MGDDLKWLIGTAVTVILTTGGMMITAFRNLSAKDDALHSRISALKDKMTDDYVRREDLATHLANIDGNIKAVRDEQTRNFDQLFAEIRSLRK